MNSRKRNRNTTPPWALAKIRAAKKQQLKNLDLSVKYEDKKTEKLRRIPPGVFELTELEVLNLYNNQISVIPKEISQLRNLSELDLSGNRISVIPNAIAQLQNLSVLSLLGNQINVIPEATTQLQNLSQLDLSYNQISVIPETIGQLRKLSTLDIYNNRITVVPEVIGELQDLLRIDFSYNPLTEPPLEVVKQGINSIRDYYRQLRESETDTLYEAKLLIIGEPDAGKTTLAKKIQNPDYPLSTEQTTEGIDIIQYQFPLENGHTFRVNIWDFGGQEIYHATHQFFLTKRSLYALVNDSRAENTDFYYWLNTVELLSDASPLLIIQNQKQDRKGNLNQTQLRGQFPHLKDTLETNLATNRGLPQLLDTLKHHLKQLPHIGSTLPKTWVNVRNAIDTDPRNTLSLDQYLDLCTQNGFTRRSDALQLSGYLHDLGVCLHFQDDESSKLYDTLILKPTWGTAAVYKVLDSKTVRNHYGRFNWDDLKHIWADDEYAHKRGELLELMKKFELCYEIPTQPRHYIAPQLLGDDQPAYEWNDTQNLILRYTYEFMPKGIISRFIVALHELIHEQRYVWKSGVLLSKDNSQAEVIEYYGKREIKIRIRGSNKRDLMTIVTHELDKIHASYHRLKYQKLIPCNCLNCDGTQNPHFYDFNKLRERIAYRKHTIECGNPPYADVNVLDLLKDMMEVDRIFPDERDYHPRTIDRPEIFISYAWGGDSEALVNQITQAFQAKNIPIIRDKEHLGFKGRIKEFMQRIGRGKAIIVVISEKYLKSENCMFELVQIAENGAFYDRIFPIVLDDAKIYRPVDRIQYVKYWEDQINALDQEMRNVSQANLDGFRDDIDLYNEIRHNLPKLTNILKDMNTLTAKIHIDSGFDRLFQAVELRVRN